MILIRSSMKLVESSRYPSKACCSSSIFSNAPCLVYPSLPFLKVILLTSSYSLSLSKIILYDYSAKDSSFCFPVLGEDLNPINSCLLSELSSDFNFFLLIKLYLSLIIYELFPLIIVGRPVSFP